MKAINYRKKTAKELRTDLDSKQGELATIRFDVKTGKDKNSAGIIKIKKDIARIKTVINENSYMKDMAKSDKIDNTKKDLKL